MHCLNMPLKYLKSQLFKAKTVNGKSREK